MTKLHLPSSERLRPEFQRAQYLVVPQALPPDTLERWRHRAQHITQYARQIQRTDGGLQLVYRVVTGETIRDRWPELFAFYNDPAVLDWVKEVTGEHAIFTSPHLQSAVNLNIMDNVQSIYRWHFDAVAYTALLYLTDVHPEDGGALELIANCQPHQIPAPIRQPVQLWPEAGTLVLMDGTRCYHRVARLRRAKVRYSVPLVYPNSKHATRDSELDSYLYEPAGEGLTQLPRP
jgi:2-oxoglutarate-Fe(II)-dependent oxygenase superfamily protein